MDIQPPQDGFAGGCFQATADEAYIYWGDTGTIAISRGNEIVVDPLPDADERIVRLVILGAAMACLLHQRGLLVLHASVVAIRGRAIAFLGAKCAGKSTMVAAMHARGHVVVSDDIAAIDITSDDLPIVHPSMPQIKLAPDSASSLGVNPESMSVVDPTVDKRRHCVRDTFASESMPLDRIYILVKGKERKIEPLSRQQACIELVRYTVHLVARIFELSGGEAEHFSLCTKLAGLVPVFRMTRPPSLDTLDDIARWGEYDITQDGESAQT